MRFTRFRQTLLAVSLALLTAAGTVAAPTGEPVRVVAITVPGTPWHDSWLHFSHQLETRDSSLEPIFYLTGQLG